MNIILKQVTPFSPIFGAVFQTSLRSISAMASSPESTYCAAYSTVPNMEVGKKIAGY